MGSSRRLRFLLMIGCLLVHGLGLSGQQPSPHDQEIAKRFRAGQQDMRAQRFEEAVVEFKEVLRLEPELTEARVNLGLAYNALGDYRLALPELSRAASQKADSLPANLFLGVTYLKLGNPEKAILPLRHALKLDASNGEARHALATAELWQGDYAQAAVEFRNLATTDPEKADGWFTLGHDYLEMAKRLTTQLTAQFADSAWSFRLAGDVLAGRHLWNDAASAYRKALRADPRQPGLQGALADVLRQQGQQGETAQGEAAGQNPSSETLANSVDALSKRAPSRAACESENKEQLCAEFLKSQKQLHFADLLRLGQALFALGDDEAASDAFGAAFAERKASPESIYWLCRSYLRLADDCFDQLTALSPDSWRAHEFKAEGFHIRQADREALAEYRAAERLNPQEAKIHEALGEILLGEKALPEARSELEAALRLDSAAPRSLYLMGRLCVAEGDAAKGIRYLEAALRYDPTLVEGRAVLGKAYLKAGKPRLAVAQLERSAEIDRYGDLHYLLYEAYRQEGKADLSAKALARSQELRRKSAADDQAKIRRADVQ